MTKKRNSNNETLALKMAKIIRVCTPPPILAFAALTLLYFFQSEIFGSPSTYLLSLVFLTLLPLLAYPLQPLVPGFKDKGREGQRNLAIVMAVVGYLCGIVYALTFDLSSGLKIVFLTYIVSGLGILICNKGLHIKASGHACGTAGPITYLTILLGPRALIGAVLLVLVFWSSLETKRHTLRQLIIGSIISIVAAILSALIFGAF